jgi:hypothetical protein
MNINKAATDPLEARGSAFEGEREPYPPYSKKIDELAEQDLYLIDEVDAGNPQVKNTYKPKTNEEKIRKRKMNTKENIIDNHIDSPNSIKKTMENNKNKRNSVEEGDRTSKAPKTSEARRSTRNKSAPSQAGENSGENVWSNPSNAIRQRSVTEVQTTSSNRFDPIDTENIRNETNNDMVQCATERNDTVPDDNNSESPMSGSSDEETNPPEVNFDDNDEDDYSGFSLTAGINKEDTKNAQAGFFEVIRTIQPNDTTGWATYICTLVQMDVRTLVCAIKTIKLGNKDFIVINFKGMKEWEIEGLKSIENERIKFSPKNTVLLDGKVTIIAHVGVPRNDIIVSARADEVESSLNNYAAIKGIKIDKIVTRFLENNKYPFVLLIFKKEEDGIKWFDRNTGNCRPIVTPRSGLIIRVLPATTRFADSYKWVRIIIKNVSYDEETAVTRVKEMIKFKEFGAKVALVNHIKSPVSGRESRNVIVIARSRMAYKIIEEIREKKPEGTGPRGTKEPITAELDLVEISGRYAN